MSAKKVNKAAIELFIYVAALFVLLLASINIENYLAPKKVLGAETKVDSTEQFWNDFLTKNPNYIPGWKEIGQMDKARGIDPNYNIKP
ncbi:MAG: hypothetical protein ABSC49_00805 [Candidatus Microgenomates bacterium]|jgi:hypothetical protein